MFASSGLSKSLHGVTTQKTVIYKQEFATSIKWTETWLRIVP